MPFKKWLETSRYGLIAKQWSEDSTSRREEKHKEAPRTLAIKTYGTMYLSSCVRSGLSDVSYDISMPMQRATLT